jgi:hypothetical protein
MNDTQASLPTFAVVGYPNVGKTTVLATLAEDESAEISDMPGETIVCREYGVRLENREVFRLVDTPGFEEQMAALAWMKDHQKEHNLPLAFRKAHLAAGRFPRECEIMKPLAEGAAVIYVVDASRPPQPEDAAEMEILRLLGLPRVAVINARAGATAWIEDWTRELNRYFQVVRRFNAHHATFSDRLALLRSMRSVREEWETIMDPALDAMERDWIARLRDAARRITRYLKDVLETKVSVAIQPGEDRDSWTAGARQEFFHRLERLENEMRKDLLIYFRHARWKPVLDEYPELEGSLTADETWKMLGLTKMQLATLSAIIGATTGGLIDLKTLGASWGIGALIGGVTGFGVGFLGVDHMVSIKLPGEKWVPFWMRGKKFGDVIGAGVKGELMASPRSNLFWG